MNFKNIIKPKKNIENNGPYLKYEEGEVIPVEKKNSNYPPFLNDDNEIKSFKDIQREDFKKKSSNTLNTSFQSEPSSNSQRISISPSLITKVIWVIIIGGLVYYSIPMFKYFISESTTPQLNEQLKVSEKIEDQKNKLRDASEDITDNLDKTKNIVSNHVNESFSKGKDSLNEVKEEISSQSEVKPLTNRQWLDFITNMQNQKQEALISLQQFTNQYNNMQLTQSQYRFKIKGIKRKVERIEKEINQTISSQDTFVVNDTINSLNQELEHLKKMTIHLGSVSGDEIVNVFNEEIEIQNQFTESYKTSLKSLLHQYGISYTEKNGVINYQ